MTKSKKEGSVQAKEATAEPTTMDLMVVIRGAMIFVVPISVVVAFLASWVAAYSKWGSVGLLYNGLGLTVVGALIYKVCDNMIEDSEVDSDQTPD
jgi:hypothetical protein